MEVIDPRSALLCNYEVLTLLQGLEREQTAKAKANFLVKKEHNSSEDARGISSMDDEASENLRTIEFETIQYLSAEYHPIRRQTERGIQKLTKDLGKYKLTKAEKLQIVNLAPTEPVELYIVEELEDRLTESMDEILSLVKSTLSKTTSPSPAPDYKSPTHPEPQIGVEGWNAEEHDQGYEDFPQDDMVADADAGGFEGDLEMGDEED